MIATKNRHELRSCLSWVIIKVYYVKSIINGGTRGTQPPPSPSSKVTVISSGPVTSIHSLVLSAPSTIDSPLVTPTNMSPIYGGAVVTRNPPPGIPSSEKSGVRAKVPAPSFPVSIKFNTMVTRSTVSSKVSVPPNWIR